MRPAGKSRVVGVGEEEGGERVPAPVDQPHDAPPVRVQRQQVPVVDRMWFDHTHTAAWCVLRALRQGGRSVPDGVQRERDLSTLRKIPYALLTHVASKGRHGRCTARPCRETADVCTCAQPNQGSVERQQVPDGVQRARDLQTPHVFIGHTVFLSQRVYTRVICDTVFKTPSVSRDSRCLHVRAAKPGSCPATTGACDRAAQPSCKGAGVEPTFVEQSCAILRFMTPYIT